MTVEELVKEVCRRGVMMWANPPNVCIAPAKKVPPALKAELKARKAEVIEYMKTVPPAYPERLSELDQKRRKCEAAGVTIAIFENGDMKVCRTPADVRQSAKDGGVLYTPEDMYYRAQLTWQEQQLLHRFKKTFPGGSTQWKRTER